MTKLTFEVESVLEIFHINFQDHVLKGMETLVILKCVHLSN